MDPFTLMSMAGTGLNIVGKLMGGASSSTIDQMQSQAQLTQAQGYDAQARGYASKADLDATNTGILNTQADIAGMGVDFAASKEKQALGRIAETGRQTLAAQRSYFAGGNLDPTFGSPLLAQAITAGRIATDVDLTKASFAVDKANAMSNEATIRGQAAGSAGQGLSDMISGLTSTLSAGAARTSATAYGVKASADSMAGIFGAGTALLSGVGNLKGAGFSMPSLNLTSMGFNPIVGIAG